MPDDTLHSVYTCKKKKIYMHDMTLSWMKQRDLLFLYSEMLRSISRLVIPHHCSISNWWWCALSLWKRKEFLKSNLLDYFLAYWIKQDVTGILFIVMICTCTTWCMLQVSTRINGFTVNIGHIYRLIL